MIMIKKNAKKISKLKIDQSKLFLKTRGGKKPF